MIERKIFIFDLKNILRDRKNLITMIINLTIQLLLCLILIIIKASNNENYIEPISIYNHTNNLDSYVFLINYIYPVFSLIFLSIIPFVIGLSLVSNEKETGTLEALFYLPVNRKKIFYTKIFSLFLISYGLSFISIMIQLFLFYFTSGKELLDYSFWLRFIFLYIPFWILFISSILIIISTISKNTKEANQYSLGFSFLLLLIIQGSALLKINIFSHHFFRIILILSIITILITIMWFKRNLRIEKVLFQITKF